MGDVIPLNPITERVRLCPCGSQWFALRGRYGDPADAEHGAVCLTADGRVAAYSGTPHCLDCGLRYGDSPPPTDPVLYYSDAALAKQAALADPATPCDHCGHRQDAHPDGGPCTHERAPGLPCRCRKFPLLSLIAGSMQRRDPDDGEDR